ncbi:DEAD/DEAH box helicase [Salipaludibacillus sp. HK11]|uniref:DEAD/DEAH box helicase n=1 Tax=Salipaludibacillus sp. HK11 TaxID=3394320 RepID=UPI0039FB9206
MSKAKLNDKVNIAKKILDFWYIVDFLDQESFPISSKENTKNIQQEKNLHGRENSEVHKIQSKITPLHDYPGRYEISEIIDGDNTDFKRHTFLSNNFHLCIGRLRREIFIKELYRILKLADDRPELDNGNICLYSLKVDKNGVYQENSFRLSPLVWGIYQCHIANGNLESQLSYDNYQREIKLIEEKINKTDLLKTTDILTLYQKICDKYLKPMLTQEFDSKPEGKFIYTRYSNEKTFLREDSKLHDVSELVKSFYSSDLKIVRDSLDNFKSTPMLLDIIDYIVSTYYQNTDKGKNNTVEDRINIRESKGDIEKWLYADLAPNGKWPSKFSPALMQQIAINIGISDSEKTRNIFSVNGPPGTGKTTLLKEVIVSNIVDRANILCSYAKSDDAFEKRHFNDGEEINNSYDKYCNKFYALKDERISQYSILVASNNNAAVENITKELPDMDGILSSLTSHDKDSQETKDGLSSVSSLFDVSKTKNMETYSEFPNNNTRSKPQYIEKNDVYFSHLANKLFTEDDNAVEEKYWGIISAPMGKSSNIRNYSYKVLHSLIDSFYANNQMIKDRHQKFEDAKKEFKEQLALVNEMKENLNKVSRLSEEQSRTEATYRSEISSSNILIKGLKDNLFHQEKDLQVLEAKIASKDEEISKQYNIRESMQLKLKKESQHLQILKEQLNFISEKLSKHEDERKIYELLFSRWINTERLTQIKDWKQKKQVNISDTTNIENTINKLNIEFDQSQRLKQQLISDKSEIEKIIKRTQESIDKLEINIKNEKLKIEDTERVIESDRKEVQAKLSERGKDMTIINDNFWNDFTSKDIKINTSAQTSNPWLTDEYNRARETLFYLGLQVHKEFILSSISCRDNFKNLLMMWKYKENDKKELCNYSKQDKETAFPHLLNTLFLLTPVMSTTFASVGRFLGDIKEQGSLGLLIIDEAGQAAPHISIGALWRSKKAIIVGDPKQVEPVVTADADAIKKAFSDKTLLPYLDKTISVQEFADKINRFGSYIKDSMNEDLPPTWVGCPLIVHRRCINPMFDISNALSYDHTMKIQTAKAKEEDEMKFVLGESCWLNISGKENGQKDHFVYKQGQEAVQIIIKSFESYSGLPDLYVISPFTTVINGVRNLVKQSKELKPYKNELDTWLETNCGTVHKFQGKEAKEVIFILGCDENASGAVRWVKPNIINVAATRAKYRLYVIGDYNVWKQSKIFQITNRLINNSAGL